MHQGKHTAFRKHSVFGRIVTVIFVIELLFAAAAIVYISFLKLLPLKYILLLIAAVLAVGGLQFALLYCKKGSNKDQILLKTLCLLLSLVVVFLAGFGVSILDTVYRSVSKMPDDDATVKANKAEVTNESFLIYLSGVDTRGATTIPDKALSDVNMLLVINPETHKVLMVNVPRDYYVPLEGNTARMDKLTHAGTYGIECSMKTLEALFDIEFNYYVRVNFKSVHDIVNAVGGITVHSDFNFNSKHSYTKTRYYFHKGENTLMGDAALAFARERESFANGDRQRGIHQQVIIKAVAEKVMSPSIILNTGKLKTVLDAVTENTKTNISYDEISKLVQMQLDKMPSWDFETTAVDGRGASRATYTGGSAKRYVMIPDESTIAAAKRTIQSVIDPKSVSSAPTSSNTQ